MQLWKYSILRNSWAEVGETSALRSRYSFSLAAADNGIFLFGGILQKEKTVTNELWFFDCNKNAWRQQGPGLNENSPTGILVPPRTFTSMSYNPDENTLWVFGGSFNVSSDSSSGKLEFYELKMIMIQSSFNHAEFLNDLWSFSLSTKMWENRAEGNIANNTLTDGLSYPAKRAMHNAIGLHTDNDWRMFISSGRISNEKYTRELWVIYSDANRVKPVINDLRPATAVLVGVAVASVLLFAVSLAVWFRKAKREQRLAEESQKEKKLKSASSLEAQQTTMFHAPPPPLDPASKVIDCAEKTLAASTGKRILI